MNRHVSRPGKFGIVTNYLSKIMFILRTRNIYGYNSVCMRIFMLIIEGTRKYGRA